MDRRDFIKTGGWGIAGLTLVNQSLRAVPPATDVGLTQDGKVTFPVKTASTEPSEIQPPNPSAPPEKIGFAVVGLGRLSLEEILPAFAQSKKAKLTALVSGTPDKANAVATQYGISSESIYRYENFEQIRDNPDIKAVYIVLPNALHSEYTIRAAQVGKHVLCEKPMSVSSSEAQKMVEACSRAQRKLMIAYRCQYEVCHRSIIEAVRRQTLGPIGIIEAVNFQDEGDIGQWRLRKNLSGGGSLPDVGLYCLNTSRAILNEEPIEVSARIFNPTNDPRFKEVEDTISFTLRFPSGAMANCASSYSLHQSRHLRVYGTSGLINLENAFGYSGQQLTWNHVEQGTECASHEEHEAKNQFALELDHMADCILRNVTPHTPGEEGVQDQRIMEALYKSAQSNLPVRLAPLAAPTRGPDPTT